MSQFVVFFFVLYIYAHVSLSFINDYIVMLSKYLQVLHYKCEIAGTHRASTSQDRLCKSALDHDRITPNDSIKHLR